MSNTSIININNQEVVFENKDEQVFCTSLDVAKVFGKRHDDVLKAIRNILNDLREIGTSQDLRNFGETYRNTEIRGFGKVKGKTRKDRCYNLTRDGFSLLAIAIQKREYYYTSPLGTRLFNLALGKTNLAFTGISDKVSVKRVNQLYEQYKENWAYKWLEEKEINYKRFDNSKKEEA